MCDLVCGFLLLLLRLRFSRQRLIPPRGSISRRRIGNHGQRSHITSEKCTTRCAPKPRNVLANALARRRALRCQFLSPFAQFARFAMHARTIRLRRRRNGAMRNRHHQVAPAMGRCTSRHLRQARHRPFRRITNAERASAEYGVNDLNI